VRFIWVSPDVPYPLKYGGAIRTYYLLKKLSSEHNVTLACLSNSKSYPKELEKICAQILLFPMQYNKQFSQIIAILSGRPSYSFIYKSNALNDWMKENADNYDAVVIDKTHMAWTYVPTTMKKIINLHNIESEMILRTGRTDMNILRGLYRKLDGKILEKEEKRLLKKSDGILVTSDREKNILRSWGCNMSIATIPNGVDVERFSTRLNSEQEKIKFPDILFIGSINYYPNEQGIIYFHNKIWPIIKTEMPEIKFSVFAGGINRQIRKIMDPNISFIPDGADIIPYFKRSKLFIVPLLSGGGTRIKILEAAAAGIPVVTTSIGCEGLPFKDKVHCLIADDPESFAQACLNVLNDPESAKQRADKAYEVVKKEYNWDDIGRKMTDNINSIVLNKT